MNPRFALESSHALRLVVALLILSSACFFSFARAEEARESILDRKVSIEKETIRDLPKVPRLCDAVNVPKERINVDDCELYCEREGTGVPIVLVNGGPGGTHHYFHPSFSRAAAFAQVIYYDQRGCGLSEFKPGSGYTVDQATDDLENLRKALGLGKWVVVGHSYGGLLAQCYAMRYPDSLKGLVLVGASPGEAYKGGSRQGEILSEEEQRAIARVHSA
ncbi:MAG: alpha/beta fold hydrolase, partial [Candidatus Hydrogenedentales bacterium]